MKNQTMFENYPDVVEVDDLCKMLGGISRKLAYRLLAGQKIKNVRIGRAYNTNLKLKTLILKRHGAQYHQWIFEFTAA